MPNALLSKKENHCFLSSSSLNKTLMSLTVSCVVGLSPLSAAQTYACDEFNEVTIHASHTDLNRLSVQNDRIMQVVFLGDVMDIDKDERLGQIFFFPKKTTKKRPLRVTLTTEKGKTQDILIHVKDEVGQTIILQDTVQSHVAVNENVQERAGEQPRNVRASHPLPQQLQAKSPLQKTHARIQTPLPELEICLQGRIPEGFYKTPHTQENFVHYRGPEFQIFGFRYTNRTDQSVELKPEDFKENNSVMDVVMDHSQLAPGDSCWIYKAVRYGESHER